MNNEKKLNLNKYSFLFFIKGDFYCWINNDANYINYAKKDDLLIKLSPWRWKSLTDRKSLSDLDKPATILDGNDASNYSRFYIEKKYPDLEIYDFNNLSLDISTKRTEQLLKNEDNFIIFEGAFKYDDFSIRADILIKKNSVIRLIELKAVTAPLYYHALDILFQYKIIRSLNYDLKKSNLRLLTLNKNFYHIRNYKITDNILNLFREWSTFFYSRPSNLEKAIEKNHGAPIEQLLKNEKYFEYFDFFDQNLEKIKEIQLLDNPPILPFKESNFKNIDSDYDDYYLKLKGGLMENSIFNYSGDSGFNKWKKAKYFENGFKTIESLTNDKIISKTFLKNVGNETVSWFLGNNNIFSLKETDPLFNVLKDNSKSLKRVIQRDAYILNKQIIMKDKIKDFLSNFKKVIYMFDFETVQNAIPRNFETSPYEQVPYQYSIHVILDKDDFDFKTMKNIVHLEWLAEEKDFYNQFWENFIKDISKYGDGSYVSYNKSFENMIINNRVEKSIDLQEINFLNNIVDETLDLMIPFSEKWYYDNDFKGRYTIKLVAPHFAPELDYSKLDKRVQKGDQSAKQCKIWLIKDNKEFDEVWKEVRPAMLKYCMYDTLSMVVIFQKLQELVS